MTSSRRHGTLGIVRALPVGAQPAVAVCRTRRSNITLRSWGGAFVRVAAGTAMPLAASSLFVGILSTAGCTGVGDEINRTVSQAQVAESTPLSVNPRNLNFSNVIVGTTSTAEVTLTNTGEVDIIVSQAAVTGAGFSTSGIGSNLILSPNQSAILTVNFGPTRAGTSTGSVTLSSNVSGTPVIVQFSGTGVEPRGHSVTLYWEPSVSVVIGYNIYRGTRLGGPYTRLNASPIRPTSYADENVDSGQIYFYVVTAVDPAQVESAYSNETSAAIP